MLEEVILSKYRGFCAGVDYAVNALEDLLKLTKPIYAKHKIVHNNYVVDGFKKRGAIFVENLEEVPRGNIVVLSAHGSSKDAKEHAKELGLKIYDAVCPLVAKVQNEAIKYNSLGYDIIYICHPEHIESKGIMSFAPMHIIQNSDDLINLDIKNNKISILTQTTLSLDEINPIIDKIKEKYPEAELPRKDDVCYATQNRQDSIKEISKLTDLVLVIGADISSNSKRLEDVSRRINPRTYLIESYHDINKGWLNGVKKLGITLSASAPEFLLEETLQCLRLEYGKFNIVNKNKIDEGIKFKPLTLK